MLRRIYAIFQGRNREFMRDRASLSWNLLLPVALVFGLSFVFSGDRNTYTIGVLAEEAQIDPGQPRMDGLKRSHRFRHYVNLGKCESRWEALLDDFEWSPISSQLSTDRRVDEQRQAAKDDAIGAAL